MIIFLALRTVYNEDVSTFEELIEKDNSVPIHVRNLRLLVTQLYKTKENLATLMMCEILKQWNIKYNLCSQTNFQLGSVKTVSCSLKALRCLGRKIWKIVPFEIKNSETLAQFAMKIESWKPTHCPCNLCQSYFLFPLIRTYITLLLGGFINFHQFIHFFFSRLKQSIFE